MKTLKQSGNHQINLRTLSISCFIGAAIGLGLILLFLSGTQEHNPEWGKYWMLRPLIIVPLAGAVGGLCFYLLDQLNDMAGLNKISSVLLGVLIFIIGLWLGLVLGLDGTYWD